MSTANLDPLDNFRNRDRAKYVQDLLGDEWKSFNMNTLKSAIDGTRHHPITDTLAFARLVHALHRKKAMYSKLGRNNELTNQMKQLKKAEQNTDERLQRERAAAAREEALQRGRNRSAPCGVGRHRSAGGRAGNAETNARLSHSAPGMFVLPGPGGW